MFQFMFKTNKYIQDKKHLKGKFEMIGLITDCKTY